MAGLAYISDTGSVSANLLQPYPGYQDFNVTNHHAIYVFDVADGLKVSREGYVLTSTGSSVESP
jgi:hypothetical protein